MADVPDWLLDLSGGALGLNRGAVLAADPYKAWDAVQKTGLENRNLEAEQLARENPDINYYGNKIGAQNVASQLASSKGLSDIYGTDTALAMQKALGPGSAFQAEVQARGFTPDMPEYMLLAQRYIGQYNPQAGINAETLFKIPEAQNRNLMDQFNETYVQAYARMKDPNAVAVRQPDGTFVIYGSQGEKIPVNVDQLARIVSFMKTNDPELVMRQGIETAGKVQADNARLITSLAALQRSIGAGIDSPAVQQKALDRLMIAGNQQIKALMDENKALDQNYVMKEEDRDARKAANEAKIEEIRKSFQQTEAQLRARAYRDLSGGGQNRGTSPLSSNTGSVLTTRPLGSGAAQAIGRPVPQPAPGQSKVSSAMDFINNLYGQGVGYDGGGGMTPTTQFGVTPDLANDSALTAHVQQLIQGSGV